jgi:hypothetical protein
MSNQNNEHKRKRLTIDELRNCKGFENYTDEQAEETISSLEKLSVLFYELFMKSKNSIHHSNEVEYESKTKSQKRNVA